MNQIKFEISPDDQRYVESYCQTNQVTFTQFLADLLKLHKTKMELETKHQELDEKLMNFDKKKEKKK